MAKSVNQKGKILYLEKILLATDEKHTCSMQDILSQLMQCGIKAERKSIYDDMEVLRGFGMDIRFRRGKPGGYYLAGENTRRAEKEHQMEFSVNEIGNIVLVDYKTDYVENGKELELVEKYKNQLELYKQALEEALNTKVDKVYIYSVYLEKEIEI